MLETPALCTLNVDENFAWGDDLVNTHFKSSTNPIFNIDIAMNDETAYYLTDLESFEVWITCTLFFILIYKLNDLFITSLYYNN